jgi:hypothetical protein
MSFLQRVITNIIVITIGLSLLAFVLSIILGALILIKILPIVGIPVAIILFILIMAIGMSSE